MGFSSSKYGILTYLTNKILIRSKCSCWRKTFEATTFTYNSQPNTSVGYRGRRLYEMVNTGIFECNSNCKCDHRCSNRVVQNGISLRLQLFKTTSNQKVKNRNKSVV